MATKYVVQIEENIMDDNTKLLTEAKAKVWILQRSQSNLPEADLVLI